MIVRKIIMIDMVEGILTHIHLLEVAPHTLARVPQHTGCCLHHQRILHNRLQTHFNNHRTSKVTHNPISHILKILLLNLRLTLKFYKFFWVLMLLHFSKSSTILNNSKPLVACNRLRSNQSLVAHQVAMGNIRCPRHHHHLPQFNCPVIWTPFSPSFKLLNNNIRIRAYLRELSILNHLNSQHINSLGSPQCWWKCYRDLVSSNFSTLNIIPRAHVNSNLN